MRSRRAVFVSACLALLSFGVVIAMLGSVLPSLLPRFGIDKAAGGALFILMNLGIVAGSVVFGPVVDRRGYKGLVIAAAALLLIALEGIAFAPTLGWLRAAVVVMGFAGGILNGSANAIVADISEGQRGAGLSLLAAFFGVGAMSVPLVLGVLPARFSSMTLIAGVGASLLVPIALFATTQFPAPKQGEGFLLGAASQLLRDGTMLLMGVMLAIQSGMESAVGGWTSTFLEEQLGVAERRAVLFLSLYWTGMTVSRLALGFVLRRVVPRAVLYGAILIVIVTASVLATTQSVVIAVVASFLLGASFAPVFPLMLGFIGDRYPTLSGTAFSLAFAMALGGGMFFPYGAGVLGDRYGMRAALAIIPVSALVLGVLLRALFQSSKSPAASRAEASPQ
jgi:MFS transporter, FHS family, glucose/mannose:H+ symporter